VVDKPRSSGSACPRDRKTIGIGSVSAAYRLAASGPGGWRRLSGGEHADGVKCALKMLTRDWAPRRLPRTLVREGTPLTPTRSTQEHHRGLDAGEEEEILFIRDAVVGGTK